MKNKPQHLELVNGGWYKLTFFEQMANIGSEVGRTINWKSKNKEFSQKAFYRALELLDLTIADSRNRQRLRELLRLRETLIDRFIYDNQYHSTDKQWQQYFYGFNYAARA